MKYYTLLGLSPTATADQIKTAYRALAKKHHPDLHRTAPPKTRRAAEEQFKKIAEAYAILSDPARRAQYDASLAPQRAPVSAYATDPYERQWSNAEVDEWVREAMEREAEAYARAEARRAERQRREAAEQTSGAPAHAKYPHVRAQGDQLILTFAQGVWTKLLRVPAGEFQMGSDLAHDPLTGKHEGPPHRVVVSEFYMSQFPITNAQYQFFIDHLQRKRATDSHWKLPVGRETHPAVNVTWDAATEFCRWLRDATGRPFRLPTEAEWEKAARGPDGRLYPWGNAWNAACLNSENTQGGPSAVGQYSPTGDSPYGLADLSGNVWEWCADWFSPRAYAQHARVAKDPYWAEQAEGCVARGGAFDSSLKQTRCAYRNWFYPYQAKPNVGFRVVVAPLRT